MGHDVSCAFNCFEMQLGNGDEEAKKRTDQLKAGQKFMKSALLGISQREVNVLLAEDTSKIQYVCSKTTWSPEEKGEIDLTTQVKTVKMTGTSGLQLIGNDGDKVLLEIFSEDPKVRDQWVLALNELLQEWILHPEKKPKSNLTAAGTSKKAEYFKMREEEIKEREKAAKEVKAKYASGGMKYTAIAMANRADL